jgi:pyruvate/2-oxoglutarate dehydrogenase complex dihydrolipoamide acyltransferase (E2) component
MKEQIPMSVDRIEKLDHAERWLSDGLDAIDSPGGFMAVEVDMSQANALRMRMREAGVSVTHMHMVIRAVASVLTKHSDLHRLVAGRKRLIPSTVDLCLSIAGEASVTPVLIIKDAGRKGLEEIADEVRNRASEARIENQKLMEFLRKWGWLLPGSLLRRSLVRSLLNRLWYRRRVSGTFQVSFVPAVGLVVPFLFNTAAALSAGLARDRVIAVNGQIQIRPILIIACCINHKVWNGLDGVRFLGALKKELESL